MQKSGFTFKAGLFGIGLEAYWEQFAGLKDRLERNLKIVEDKIKSYHCEVINLGLIDNPEKAIVAGHDFRKADVDISDRTACCSKSKSARHNTEPCSRSQYRFCGFQQNDRQDQDDR
jgi:L-arabinose isomerase